MHLGKSPASDPPSHVFFGRENTPIDHPRIYYAYVDQIEPLESDETGPITVLLDAIGSTWFDEFSANSDSWEILESAPLAVFDIQLPAITSDKKMALELRAPGAWYRLEFDSRGEIPATRFVSLFGPGELGAVSHIMALDTSTSDRIKKFFSLQKAPEIEDKQIRRIMRGRDKVDFVNVFDVGQGNANALWNDNHGATLYFDAGGGVLRHAKTYPTGLTFCTTKSPPVILSHWDWDHWSSAYTHGVSSLRDVPWIVPDQGSLSGVHAAFASDLLKRGNLYRWPKSWPERTFGRVTIQQCTGKNRNDSGLAVLIRGPEAGDDPILLTGDADYRCIPATSTSAVPAFHAVVAPHHGGRPRTKHPGAVSNSDKLGRLVYSYGDPNYYGHPHVAALSAHRSMGWSIANTRHTAVPKAPRPQNIGISWGSSSLSTGCGKCDPLQT